jgi:hypothetical protein
MAPPTATPATPFTQGQATYPFGPKFGAVNWAVSYPPLAMVVIPSHTFASIICKQCPQKTLPTLPRPMLYAPDGVCVCVCGVCTCVPTLRCMLPVAAPWHHRATWLHVASCRILFDAHPWSGTHAHIHPLGHTALVQWCGNDFTGVELRTPCTRAWR